MTYTFKLARRLAVSQHFSVLATIALLAACNGDATAPEAGPPGPPAAINAVQISPQAVTIETNQRVQFRRTTRNLHGDRVVLPSVWATTGGLIGADGTFSSDVEGTFKVTGRGRGWQSDTSIVTVVSQKKGVVRLAVAPDSASVEAGASFRFSVNGYRRDGSSTTIGVTWSASGGEIDPAGVFTADSVPGTYQVIAANVAQTIADTVPVRVVAATSAAPEPPTEPTPEPPAPPAPPAEPTVTAVVLKPGNASLATGAAKQFAAFGRTSAGDSVAVRVAFSATGGTIGSNGLYTAGASAGSFKVIAVASGLADTAVVTLTAPTAPAPTLPSGTGSGIPFGPFAAWDGSSLRSNTGMFTLTVTSVTPSTIVSKISEARTTKTKLLLAMTGGAHDNYLTFGAFDRTKWNVRMDAFNQPAIQAAVAGAVADGTIVGNVVMDEPNVSGSGDGNTWGPPGTMTKARVDSLCGYVKELFPTLPAGVQHRHDIFEPTKSYRVCDFVASQYSSRIGDVAGFRDSGLAMARRDGHAILFAMNILNGGVQDKDGVYDCAGDGQGGVGTYSPNCRMTAEQVRDVGLTLGPAGCGFMIWRYDATFMADPANQQAFRDVGARLASATPKACRRS